VWILLRAGILLSVGSLAQTLLGGEDTPSFSSPTKASPADRGLPAWISIAGEERARFENVTGQGFKPVGDRYLLNRLRLSLEIRPLTWLKFAFQSEDSRVFGQNARPAPASQKDRMDLRSGYIQVGAGEGPASLRVGRQSLDFGEGRVLADPNWSNVGRTFDATRITLRSRSLKLDLFSGASVKIDPLAFDRRIPGQHFHGAYGSLAVLSTMVVEPYLLWRLEQSAASESGKSGTLNERTIGFRWAGKLPSGVDYTAELAAQSGAWAGDRIGAWMGHWLVGRTLAGAAHPTRWYVEFNRASGDAVSRDGRRGTFDSLFPASHDKYGLTDLFCSSNVQHLRVGLQYPARRGLTLGAAYNDFRLVSAKDGLYVGGKPVARSVDGTAGSHVGQEADLQAQWAVTRTTQVHVGYGRLFPGEFLGRATSGMPYGIVFVGITQRFLPVPFQSLKGGPALIRALAGK
jgi:hypothetical protein